jgi:hypothetical protein
VFRRYDGTRIFYINPYKIKNMKQPTQLWTLPEVFAEVLTRHKTGENLKEIAFNGKFRHSHFKPLVALISAVETSQENDGQIHKEGGS